MTDARRPMPIGWKKDPYDKRDRIRPVKLYGLPDHVDLEALLPEVRDQGDVGACVGFGIGANLTAMGNGRGCATGWFSPTWIYNGARFLEGTLSMDVGCYPRSALEWLTTKGSLLEEFWPYNPKVVDKRTPASELEPYAAQYPVLSYTRIIGGAAGIASALAEGHLVSIGTPWYDEWMATDAQGRLRDITPSTHPAGGHETVLYGYDAVAQVFYGQNSWGLTWGKAGRFIMPMSAFSVFTQHGGYDAHLLEVEWKPGPGPDPDPQPDPPAPKHIPTWLIVLLLAAAAAALLLLT